jgi:hypothetical protein
MNGNDCTIMKIIPVILYRCEILILILRQNQRFKEPEDSIVSTTFRTDGSKYYRILTMVYNFQKY